MTTPMAPANPVLLAADPIGGPAVDLTKIRTGHTTLAKRADRAAFSLSKRNLAGTRAQALLYVDHSGSMHRDYASGAVQALVERVLGFALAIDVDGTVPVTAWDTRLWPAVDVTVTNYAGIVDRELWHRREMGGTHLDLVLEDIRTHAEKTGTPLFACVVTDGNPSNRRGCTALVCDLARYPVFIKFCAVRDVPYLAELDDLGSDRRVVDNVDTKVFADLGSVSDADFAEAMADEWDSWANAARRVGVVR